jgi:hypothetical protein
MFYLRAVNMKLDENINYIVSGLERSGTSMMMQILRSGGLPTAFDDSRKPDVNNPKGYYELEGGKIINKLMEKSFPMEKCGGRFIKITAFGLTFLPQRKYKIIYMERNLDEVMDSMEKMAKITDENRDETKESFKKLNEKMKRDIQSREDVDVLFVNYNKMLERPEENIKRVCSFLNLYDAAVNLMVDAIDNRLYRQRR